MLACLARVYYMVEEEYNAAQDKKSVNIKNGIVILLYVLHTNIPCRSTKPVRAVQEVNKSIDAMKRLLCKGMV